MYLVPTFQTLRIYILTFCFLTIFSITFIFTNPVQAQVGIPASGVDLDGYAWSDTIGWISMNCRTGGTVGGNICGTSNYKVSISSAGAITGYAWSSNIGWVRFGGLSDFPTAGGTTAVNARVTGTYPNLTLEGWARACAGDSMDGSCNVVVSTSTPGTDLVWSQTGTSPAFKVTAIGSGNSSNIAYGNGKFVALSNTNGQVLNSVNGSSWTSVAAPAGEWLAITYGNGLFVAITYVGTNRVMTSPDGVTWTTRNVPIGGGAALKSVTFGNGLFVAVSCGMGTTCNANAGNRVATSPDGITWTGRTSPIAVWNAIAYGNGLFVAVSESLAPGNVMTSTDGITWTARTAPQGLWGDIEYGNGRFVATAWSKVTNVLMTSTDGITWNNRLITPEDGYTSLVFLNPLFVASWYDVDVAGNPSSISTSPDGITWTKQSYFEPGSFGKWYSLGASAGSIVVGTNVAGAVTYRGEFSTSTPYTGTGWDGWISLRGTSAPTYGITMTSAGASVGSYAWGSTVLGWLDFDQVGYVGATGVVSGTNCTVPQGASTCNSNISWNIQNAASPTLRNNTTATNYSTAPAGTSSPYSIRQGVNTIQVRDGSTVLASVTLTGNCIAGTDFANGSTCEVTLSPAPVVTLTTNKRIARVGDTVGVTWTITPSPLATGSCVLSGTGLSGTVTGSGSQTSGVLRNKTRFTISCTGSFAPVSTSTTVEIIPVASEV